MKHLTSWTITLLRLPLRIWTLIIILTALLAGLARP